MIDIDNFRTVNVQHDHNADNLVMNNQPNVCKRFRQSDYDSQMRKGDEGFVAVAKFIKEKMRQIQRNKCWICTI